MPCARTWWLRSLRRSGAFKITRLRGRRTKVPCRLGPARAYGPAMALNAVATVAPTTSDERLAELSSAGSERAFAALVERYREPLSRSCGRLGVPADDV